MWPKFHTICTRIVAYHMFILFICDTVACYSTYELLESGGFEIIRKACQTNEIKPQIEELCRVTQFGARYVALAAFVVWKFVGLSEFGTIDSVH